MISPNENQQNRIGIIIDIQIVKGPWKFKTIHFKIEDEIVKEIRITLIDKKGKIQYFIINEYGEGRPYGFEF